MFFKAARKRVEDLEKNVNELSGHLLENSVMLERIVQELIKQENELTMLRRAVFGTPPQDNDDEFWRQFSK
jgi:hypothetical protein